MKNIILSIFLVAVLFAIFALSAHYSSADIAVLKIGKIEDYPAGTIKFISKPKAFVIADEEGIYAISAVCTHLSCILNSEGNRLVCPCHAANFNLAGRIISGPATRNLQWYSLELDSENNIILDSGTGVSTGTKLKRIQPSQE